MNKSAETKKYMPLVGAAGIGSMLGSGIIIGLSATITVWQSGLGLTDGQVGILSEHLHLQLQQVHCSQEILQSYSD